VVEPLTIEERTGFGLATVMARHGADLAGIEQALGFAPPIGPTLAGNGTITLIGTGPGSWLAYSEGDEHRLADRLHATFGDTASICDQSSGYLLFRISGTGARQLFQRGASIDVHPSVFRPGCVATTTIAHIGVILWQLDDVPTYEIALFRSYADSFRHWLEATAATV
jgi:methylglutamate dehydrogenase subunit D